MARLANLTFACADPPALAAFWAAALGYEVQEAPPGLLEALAEQGLDLDAAAAAIDPEGRGPRLFFEKKPKATGGNASLHMDLDAADREAEVARLIALGATLIEERTRTIGPYTEVWTFMRDPEGNGFCVQ